MSQQDFDRSMNDYYRDQDHDHAPARLAERVESIPDTEPDPSHTPRGWRQHLGLWLGRDDGEMRNAGVRGTSRPTKNGRNRLMITAAGTLIAVAALALGVSFADDAALAPDDAPGAATGVVTPDDWAFFSGEMRYDGQLPSGSGSREYTENGLTVFVGPLGYAGQTFTTTDDRLTGKRSELATTILNDDDTAGSGIWMERSIIENEDGAWTCVLTNISNLEAGGLDETAQSGWCDGSGAYDGYRAYLAIGAEEGGRLSVSGFVSNADGPLLLSND